MRETHGSHLPARAGGPQTPWSPEVTFPDVPPHPPTPHVSAAPLSCTLLHWFSPKGYIFPPSTHSHCKLRRTSARNSARPLTEARPLPHPVPRPEASAGSPKLTPACSLSSISLMLARQARSRRQPTGPVPRELQGQSRAHCAGGGL